MTEFRNATIGELCNIEKGKIGIKKAIPGDFPLVVTAEDRLTHNEFHFDKPSVIIPLVSSTGHGHASIKRIHYQEGQFAVGSILCVVTPKDQNILDAYFLYKFLDLYKEQLLVSRMRGMANVTLPINEIKKIEIPLISIEEQRKWIKSFQTINENINEFDNEVFRQKDFLAKLRQAILLEAIQGKLTEQWRKDNPNVEPASELLKKIKSEKEKLIKEKIIKKQKLLAPIKPEEIPFKIPKTWQWCRLGDVCYKITDGFHNTPPKVKKGIPYILATHVKDNIIDFRSCYYVEEKYHKELYFKVFPKKGEILVVNIGAGCGTPAIIDVDFEFSFKNTAILKFNQNFINNLYLLDYLFAVREKNYEEITRGGLQPFLSLNILNNILFPLPPIFEQQEIASRVEKLFSYCDELEEQINQTQEYSEKLMQTVLKEAFER